MSIEIISFDLIDKMLRDNVDIANDIKNGKHKAINQFFGIVKKEGHINFNILQFKHDIFVRLGMDKEASDVFIQKESKKINEETIKNVICIKNSFWKNGNDYYMKTLYKVSDKWLTMNEIELSNGDEFSFLKSYFKSITINT